MKTIWRLKVLGTLGIMGETKEKMLKKLHGNKSSWNCLWQVLSFLPPRNSSSDGSVNDKGNDIVGLNKFLFSNHVLHVRYVKQYPFVSIF